MSTHRTLEQDAEAHDPLPGLRDQLAKEFGARVPVEQLTEVADQAVHLYDSARLREFVPVFAWRSARNTLKASLG